MLPDHATESASEGGANWGLPAEHITMPFISRVIRFAEFETSDLFVDAVMNAVQQVFLWGEKETA